MLSKRAEAEKAKQVAAKEAESKKRAEAQKGKQAATEDHQSQSDDFVKNKKMQLMKFVGRRLRPIIREISVLPRSLSRRKRLQLTRRLKRRRRRS
jgi:hypothetical protein